MQVDCHTFYTEYATFMQIQPIKQKNVPEAAKATALLQCLSEHLVFANVVVTDGAASESHCLFKVVLPDLWHRIILFHLLQKWYEVPSCKASKAAAEQKRVNVKTWIKKGQKKHWPWLMGWSASPSPCGSHSQCSPWWPAYMPAGRSL